MPGQELNRQPGRSQQPEVAQPGAGAVLIPNKMMFGQQCVVWPGLYAPSIGAQLLQEVSVGTKWLNANFHQGTALSGGQQ